MEEQKLYECRNSDVTERKIQIVTSLEQSKKLLDAGITSPHKAGMTYVYGGEFRREYDLAYRLRRMKEDIPAWTLSELLDCLPLEYSLCSADGGLCLLIIPNNIPAVFYGTGSLFDAVIQALIWCDKHAYKFKD